MQQNKFKFRSWDTKLKKMVEDVGIARSEFDPTENGRFIIMQFTGFKDCNGKEVYAGDMLDFYGISDKEGMVVIQDIGGFLVDESPIWDYAATSEDDDMFDELDGLEVIGNIYKNRDLLKPYQIKKLGL